jgi:hypothetical protein
MEKQDRYPRLSKITLDFVIIQFISAKCEKVFSAAGRMVTISRNRLKAEIIGIFQILQSWYLAGILREKTDVNLAPLKSDKKLKNGNNDDESEKAQLQDISEEYVTLGDFE